MSFDMPIRDEDRLSPEQINFSGPTNAIMVSGTETAQGLLDAGISSGMSFVPGAGGKSNRR
jgi:hypothetical protein